VTTARAPARQRGGATVARTHDDSEFSRAGRTGPRTAGRGRRTVLPSGLRILTESIPAVRSVRHLRRLGRRRLPGRDPDAVGRLALPRAPAVQGHPAAHALDISAAIDAVGGETNAFTAKEYTCYYARVLDADLPLAIDVLCDMVTDSVIDPATWRPSAA
jgi:predicted Zn-dependent peptidase